MIIGLCGAARSGKDTVAGILVSEFDSRPSHRLKIAGPLKAFVSDLFGWDERHTEGDLKEVPDRRYPRPTANGYQVVYLTPREAMQKLGGDYAQMTYPPIFAESAARKAKNLSDQGGLVIIDDVRFLHDVTAIDRVGGVIVQVTRPGVGLTGPAATHPSEEARFRPEFQDLVLSTVVNDGSLDDLRAKVLDLGATLGL